MRTLKGPWSNSPLRRRVTLGIEIELPSRLHRLCFPLSWATRRRVLGRAWHAGEHRVVPAVEEVDAQTDAEPGEQALSTVRLISPFGKLVFHPPSG
jgi:hypothetical protein